jgi:hypothetical protein
MAAALELVQKLTSLIPPEYHRHDEHDYANQVVKSLIVEFSHLETNQRMTLRQALNVPVSLVLLDYAWDSSMEAVRQQSRERIREGLLALAIEDGRLDFRDSLLSVAVLMRSARKFDLDPTELWLETAGYCDNEQFKAIVRRFVEEDQSKDWPIYETTSERGLTYEFRAYEMFSRGVRKARWKSFWSLVFGRKSKREPPNFAKF